VIRAIGSPLGVVMLALLLLSSSPALAHDQSFSYADVRWNKDRLEIVLSVHRDDAAPALGIADPTSLTRPEVLERYRGRLAQILLSQFHARSGGHEIALVPAGATVRPERHAVALRFVTPLDRPLGALTIEARLFPTTPQHETFLNVYESGRLTRQDVLTADRPVTELYARGPEGILAVLATFIRAGIHHIFIGPDHILFIVGLLLLGGGIGRVLKVATAFTLAHSITLASAALGLVHISSRIVEPLIALSIVYVGIENLRPRKTGRDWRMRIAFGFGLIHGFGFASVLREFGLPHEALAWSLLGFNLGVEVGQACIVLAVTPVLYALRRWAPRLAPRAVAACSCAIIVAGGWWFFQRLLAKA